jgi:hypothetical protein
VKAIWKEVLEVTDRQTIKLPASYKFLFVALQHDQISIWYVVDARAEMVERNIYIFGTGHPIPNNFDGKFIGTVLMANGNLAWHVFEE